MIVDLIRIDGVEGYLPVEKIEGKKWIVGLSEHWPALENYCANRDDYSYRILYPEGH